MSQCNYCSLRGIRERARSAGKVVTLRRGGFMGGTDVFVHPKDVDVKTLPGINVPDSPTREQYFVSWMMEIPEACQC